MRKVATAIVGVLVSTIAFAGKPDPLGCTFAFENAYLGIGGMGYDVERPPTCSGNTSYITNRQSRGRVTIQLDWVGDPEKLGPESESCGQIRLAKIFDGSYEVSALSGELRLSGSGTASCQTLFSESSGASGVTRTEFRDCTALLDVVAEVALEVPSCPQ